MSICECGHGLDQHNNADNCYCGCKRFREDCKASHPGSVYCDECDPDNVYPHKCHYSPENLRCFTCGKAFKFITINN